MELLWLGMVCYGMESSDEEDEKEDIEYIVGNLSVKRVGSEGKGATQFDDPSDSICLKLPSQKQKDEFASCHMNLFDRELIQITKKQGENKEGQLNNNAKLANLNSLVSEEPQLEQKQNESTKRPAHKPAAKHSISKEKVHTSRSNCKENAFPFADSSLLIMPENDCIQITKRQPSENINFTGETYSMLLVDNKQTQMQLNALAKKNESTRRPIHKPCPKKTKNERKCLNPTSPKTTKAFDSSEVAWLNS